MSVAGWRCAGILKSDGFHQYHRRIEDAFGAMIVSCENWGWCYLFPDFIAGGRTIHSVETDGSEIGSLRSIRPSTQTGRLIHKPGTAPMDSDGKFHLHLISDATGETIHGVARACLAQFEEVEVTEHLWPMVRSDTA